MNEFREMCTTHSFSALLLCLVASFVCSTATISRFSTSFLPQAPEIAPRLSQRSCHGSKECRLPWGQLLPLPDIDAYVFTGKAEFKQEIWVNLTKNSDEISFELDPMWNVRLKLRITDSDLKSRFEDWSHVTSDNSMILNASESSPLFELKASLQKEINSFCRHPLPKQYYLSMTPYPDRQSHAILMDTRLPTDTPHAMRLNSGNRVFQRTVNGYCKQSTHSTLADESNSFYCTVNSPLVTEVFNEYIIDTYVDQGDDRCDKARRICQSCMIRACGVKHIDWNMMLPNASASHANGNCCQIDCFASPHCTRYFSLKCYPYDRLNMEKSRICFRGKTLKFTLTPDFEFKSGNFECHIKQPLSQKKTNLQLNFEVEFSSLSTNAQNKQARKKRRPIDTSFHSNSYRLEFTSHFLPGKVHHFLGRSFYLKYHSNVPDIQDAVLQKRRNMNASSETYDYYLIDLTRTSVSKPQDLNVTRHREQKYIIIQNRKPFHFNTENWSKQGCFLNISKDIFFGQKSNFAGGIPVDLKIIPPSKKQQQNVPFSYIIREKNKSNRIQIFAKGQHRDFMKALFCELEDRSKIHRIFEGVHHKFKLNLEGNYNNDQYSSDASTSLKQILHKKRFLKFQGWVTGTPVYFNVRLSIHFQTSDFKRFNYTDFDLLDKDIVLFPRKENIHNTNVDLFQPFTLPFELDTFGSPALATNHLQIHLHIADCFQSQIFKFVINPPISPKKDKVYNKTRFSSPRQPFTNMLIDFHFFHSPRPFLILSVLLGGLYLILFIAFLMLCLCKPKRRKFIVPSILGPSHNPDSRKSSTSSTFTELAKSSTSALVVEEPSPYTSPAHENQLARIIQTRRLPVENIGVGRKVLIFLYVCFRAFTIFMFTFSVGLSLILSLESDSFKTLLSCVQNTKSDRIRELVNQEAISKTFMLQGGRRIASPWLQELKQIEGESDAELTRQTAQFLLQTATCERQEIYASGEMGNAMEVVASLVAEKRDSSASGLASGKPNNIPYNFLRYQAVVNASWDSIESEYWRPYNVSIQRYMDSARSLLDNQLMEHWTPYMSLLDKMMNNAWLSTARRAMNSSNEGLPGGNYDAISWLKNRSTSSNYLAGLIPVNPREDATLKFAGFLGISQPANARLAEARLWNRLRQHVPELSSLQESVKRVAVNHMESFVKLNLPDPFLFFTYSEFFTVDDYDVIPQSHSKHQSNRLRGLPLLISSKRNAKDVFVLYEWINASYLRIFLFVLDAYLIISRFYAACRNFCVLWIGKRHRIYQQPREQKPAFLRLHEEANWHQNQMLLGGHQAGSTNAPCSHQTPTSNMVNQAGNDLSLNQNPPSYEEVNNLCTPIATNQQNDCEIQTDRSANCNYASSNAYWYSSFDKSISTGSGSGNRGNPDHMFVGFNRRGSLPACCCCLDFHYLLILFGICLIAFGLIVSTGAKKGLVNNWLLKKSALLSRVEAMDEYRLITKNTVHYVQLNYLNSRRLLFERSKAEKHLRRLKRLQLWLHLEKEHLVRQNLHEVCVLSEVGEHTGLYSVDSSICHMIRQHQNRGYPSSSPRQLVNLLPIAPQEQQQLPLCAFLPINSDVQKDTVNITNYDKSKIPGRFKSPAEERLQESVSKHELQQLHNHLFKNSNFAQFLTSVYRLLITTILVIVTICWLLACKYLIIQMSSRTISMLTSKVTIISPCPPPPRRIESFFDSSESNLSFNRSAVSRSIWHGATGEQINSSTPLAQPNLQQATNRHQSRSAKRDRASRKKTNRNASTKRSSSSRKGRQSAESRV